MRFFVVIVTLVLLAVNVASVDAWFGSGSLGFGDLYAPRGGLPFGRSFEMAPPRHCRSRTPLRLATFTVGQDHPDYYSITSRLPGVERRDVKMSLQRSWDGRIVLLVDVRRGVPRGCEGWLQPESVRKQFYVPEYTRFADVRSSFSDGTLRIFIPKQQQQQQVPETTSPKQQLRIETSLQELVEYFDKQSWKDCSDWAQRAGKTATEGEGDRAHAYADIVDADGGPRYYHTPLASAM